MEEFEFTPVEACTGEAGGNLQVTRPRRRMVFIIAVARTFVVLVAGCVFLSCSVTPDPSAIEKGTSRQRILEDFGDPDRRTEILNDGQAVWGPIEDFWREVPAGSKVEIWSYRVEDGFVELYFVDDAPAVDGLGFHDDRAVYEAEPVPESPRVLPN